ncbi:MFS transporter [Paenibacillus sp. 481]|uniref:MFS transporter n=1 Tax=Paenibacillus sp. 481 TaxID=2835869 RepID=UPI001E5745E2|nr:MFS transporter [Paenibacillus sp. 481]UHA75591.1 MFS transporter [Paenibacillus sp. 481]
MGETGIGKQDSAGKGFNGLRLFIFLLYGGTSIFSNFFPLYLQEHGWSKAAIGTLLAVGPLLSIFANPFWGYWSDRLQNIRRILAFLLIGNMIVVQVLFQLNEYIWLFAATSLLYFFQMPLSAQASSLILTSIQGTTYQFGAFRLYGSLGWALTAVAAGPLFNALGVQTLHYVYACLLALTFASVLLLPQKPAKLDKSGKSDKPSGQASTYSARQMGRVLFSPTFAAFLVFSVLVSVPNAMNMSFVSIYITELGGSKSAVGWSIFMSSIFEIVVFLLFDRFLRRNMRFMFICLTIVSALYALRWLLMSIATDPWHIIVIQALHSITFGGFFYVGTQLTALLVPGKYLTTGQSIYTLAWGGISSMIAGFLGGTLYDSFGSTTMYLWGTLLAALGTFGFAVLMISVTRRQPDLNSENS